MINNIDHMLGKKRKACRSFIQKHDLQRKATAKKYLITLGMRKKHIFKWSKQIPYINKYKILWGCSVSESIHFTLCCDILFELGQIYWSHMTHIVHGEPDFIKLFWLRVLLVRM